MMFMLETDFSVYRCDFRQETDASVRKRCLGREMDGCRKIATNTTEKTVGRIFGIRPASK